ncbi:hypothetical protein ABK040_003099 [Willaertia magna]
MLSNENDEVVTTTQQNRTKEDAINHNEYEQQQSKKKRKLTKPVIIVFVPSKYLFPSEDDSLLLEKMDRKVYGTDIYTDDSDIILVCQHLGLLKDLTEECKGILVTVKIETSPKKFVATFRNNVRSKSWNSSDSEGYNAITVVKCRILKDQTKLPALSNHQLKQSNFNYDLEQHRFLSNVTIVFDLSGEPTVKYSINSVADKGFDNNEYTSARLIDDGEHILIETDSTRYQLCFNKETNHFEWLQLNSSDSNEKTPLVTDLSWNEIKWGPESIIVRDKEYKVKSTTFRK